MSAAALAPRRHGIAGVTLTDGADLWCSILDSLADGIIVADRHAKLLYCNPAAERIVGLGLVEGPPSEWSQRYGIFLSDGTSPCPTESLPLVRAIRGESCDDVELVVRNERRPQGVLVSVTARPLLNEQGEIGGGVLMLRDVTERRRAEEESRRSRRELRALAARLQSVREEERRRIAHEIHDELGQALTALKIDLAWLKGRLPTREWEPVGRYASVIERIDKTIAAVRRIATELRPSVLDHLGMAAAVEWQALEFERRTGITTRVDLPPDAVELEDERATAVFRIFQETLTNVARHSRATRADVALRVTGSELMLEVHDNGRGITEEELDDAHSLGLVGLRERAVACGGSVNIRGTPGAGTTVSLHIPVRPSTETEEVA
jgi:two-component system, NarL family, sensor histidine kinase UhpB